MLGSEEEKKAATLVCTSFRTKVERALILASQSSSLKTDTLGKARLQSTNNKIAAQNEAIAKTIATMAELEETGEDITTQLSGNREAIQRQKDSAKEVTSLSDHANSIATRMSRWFA
jgi:septal ring factor EnvC (AmiA/AmiB activator)